MNIKQAETLTGVSRQNIRFYEKQGLITPARNPDNDYREYSSEDLQRLKWIRAMRMLDMPLEDVGQVLDGGLSLGRAAVQQQQRLESQMEKLEGAIRLCGALSASEQLDTVDVDACLAKMEGESERGYFQQWKQDYLAVCQSEHERVFTFVPDDAITNPKEFTDALFAYAETEGVDLVITKESMYPEFTIDGIEYTAYRDYRRVGFGAFGLPAAVVHCEMVHPEEHLPLVPEKRRKRMALLNVFLPGIAVFAFVLLTSLPSFLAEGGDIWGGLLLALSLGIFVAVGCYVNWRFHFNEKHQ